MSGQIEICNNALVLLRADPIMDITENNDRAVGCKQFYQLTVDSVLRSFPWNCAIESQQLVREVATPLFKFAYQYLLPTDPYCLRVLEIEDQDVNTVFKIRRRKLFTDEDSVKINYIARVDPGEFDSLLTQTISAKLASFLCHAITGKANFFDAMMKLYQYCLDEAKSIDSQEGTSEAIENEILLTVR